MGPHRNLTRIELSRLLYADALGTEDEPRAPDDFMSTQIHDLVMLGVHGTEDDSRAVYEHLPLLMQRFFGYASGSGWLETGSDLSHQHREALMFTVRPNGPVHAFCLAHSPPIGSHPKPDEMRFEFPLSNLPNVTQDEVWDLFEGTITASQAYMVSALAPMLAPYLIKDVQDIQPAMLLLSPLEYFYMCMVASPTQKLTPPVGMYFPGSRRVRARRSASLPSTRAMFNEVLSEHLAVASGQEYLIEAKTILIAACMDYFLIPMTVVSGYADFPDASTPTVDAMTALLLVLRPRAPEELFLSNGHAVGRVDIPGDRTTAVLYATMQDVMRAAFCFFPVGPYAALGTLAAYVRLLALYLAPWEPSIISAIRAALYSKPRPTQGLTMAEVKAQSIAAITSKLSPFNSQQHGIRKSLNTAKEAFKEVKGEVWQDMSRRSFKSDIDIDLVRLAIVKCASCRLGASSEGHRALSLLADAVRAAGLEQREIGPPVNVDEVRGSLHALRDQLVESDVRAGRKGNAYVGTLGKGIGITIDRPSSFIAVDNIAGVGVAVKDMVNMMALAATGGPAGEKGRLRERRKHELGENRDNIPILGEVWDRPIQGNESETAVVLSYRLALWIEARIGVLLNLRFMGRLWFLYLSVFALCVSAVVLLGGT